MYNIFAKDSLGKFRRIDFGGSINELLEFLNEQEYACIVINEHLDTGKYKYDDKNPIPTCKKPVLGLIIGEKN